MKVRTRTTVVLLAMTAVLAAAGCAAPGSSAPPPPGSSRKTPAAEPGLERLDGGRVIANGWVAHVEIEGGFWAVMDAPVIASSAAQPKVVAVLLPGKVPESRFQQLDGSFVGAEGVLQEGASIRMAGPEVVVDAIRMY